MFFVDRMQDQGLIDKKIVGLLMSEDTSIVPNKMIVGDIDYKEI